ncbi:MAG: ABC transporter substrate-binding protein [Actinocatenispora sp.]
MSTRHWAAVGLAAVLTLTATAGCAKQESSTDSNSVIPIGVDIEKSGPAAVQGKAYERALKLVANQINQNGVKVGDEKKKIKLIIRDNKSDPVESLSVAKSLIDNDHVDAIIGGGASPTTMSLVETVEQKKVPLVSMGSSTAIVQPIADRKYIFKTPGNTDTITDVMLKQFQRKNVHRIALLSVDNAYGQAGLDAWKAVDKAGKIDLVSSQTFTDDEKDYTVQVTKMMAKNPDAVVVWAIPPGAGIAAKNLRDAKYSADKVYYDTGAGAELFVKGAGTASEGMYMVHSRVLAGDQITATTPAAQAEKKFFTDYSREYGKFSGFAPMAADALTAITRAIEKAGKDDRESIRDSLETLSFDGAFGTYQFSKTNHGGVNESSLSLLVVKNGTWTLTS